MAAAPGPAARRIHVLVSGRVQGVWFRASAQRRARELGLAGWARNLDDGRVELEAEGPPERVEDFAAWCGQGPPGARVEGLEVVEREAVGAATDFRVLPDGAR